MYAPPLDTTISQEYKDDNVTVTVEWIQHVYTVNEVTVVPLVPLMSTGSTSRQLTIQYNTEYNLSLEATAPCRPNAITFIILNYGKVLLLQRCMSYGQWSIFAKLVFSCKL